MQEHFLFWPLWKCKVLHCCWSRVLGCLISPKCLLGLNNSKRFSLCLWRWLFPSRFCPGVLSRWAQLVSVFSRTFQFSRIVIYRAKSRRSGLQWGDLLILFNRNNCSLSVGVFSFSLIWESIAAQFLTFVPHGEQTLVEKDSPSSRTTKSSFFSRSANFGNVSPFLVGATNTFSELIHPLIKLPSCVLKFYNLFKALGSFGLLPLGEAGIGFAGVLPLPLMFDPPLNILHFTEKQR